MRSRFARRLQQLAGDEATAVALSMHWDDNFFAELRAAPALSTSPRWLATVLTQRLKAAAPKIDAFVAGQSWSEYGRQVVREVSCDVRALVEHARSGVDERQAVVRATCPRWRGTIC